MYQHGRIPYINNHTYLSKNQYNNANPRMEIKWKHYIYTVEKRIS
jgi:hypothetical protein